MIVPGSSYWNLGVGNKKGEVETDKEGLETMETLGKNMTWLIKKTRPAARKKKGSKFLTVLASSPG
jgi:multimeric flavodoxin WrbA